MSGLTQNAKTLLVIGIVLVVLCAIGMMVQWSAYSEYADSKPVSVSGGPATGANGTFARALTAWSGSDQAKAEKAMNMFIFMAVGCGLGVVCLYFALKRRPEPEKPEPKQAPKPREPRRPNSPSYWQ